MRKTVWIETLPLGYRVRYWIQLPNGESHLEGAYFEEYNLAQNHKATMRLKLSAKQQNIVDPTLSPSECFNRYVRYMKDNPSDYRESTIEMKEYSLEVYLKAIPKMSDLNPKHFSEYMSDKGYNITTKSIRLRDFRAFCNWCFHEGYLNHNPMVTIDREGKRKKFKIPKSREVGRKLELSELTAILHKIHRKALLYLLFIMNEGSRRTETLLTDWKHLNLEDRTWEIPALNCKTKMSRILPLDDKVVAELEKTPQSDRFGLVFKGWGKTTPRWYIIQACKEAGIKPDVNEKGNEEWPSPHDFRHSFVSHWEADPRILMDMVGWTSLQMLKRYSHFNLSNLRKALKSTGIGAKLERFEDTPINQSIQDTCKEDV